MARHGYAGRPVAGCPNGLLAAVHLGGKGAGGAGDALVRADAAVEVLCAGGADRGAGHAGQHHPFAETGNGRITGT
jgi:hypothetical protein